MRSLDKGHTGVSSLVSVGGRESAKGSEFPLPRWRWGRADVARCATLQQIRVGQRKSWHV